MIRFQYFDGKVEINLAYSAKYIDFVKDCSTLQIVNPLIENDYLLYTPLVDKKGGMNRIIAGNHTNKDNTTNSALEEIINKVNDFISVKNTRLAEQAEIINNAIQAAKPLKVKLKEAYRAAWGIDEQIEAIRDAFNGDNTKLLKMNQDFTNLKQQILANNGGN